MKADDREHNDQRASAPAHSSKSASLCSLSLSESLPAGCESAAGMGMSGAGASGVLHSIHLVLKILSNFCRLILINRFGIERKL